MEESHWNGRSGQDCSRLQCITPTSPKIYYLKSHLSGEAKQILKGLSFDGSQYEHAWKLLYRHYGQPHIIVDSQIKLVHNFSVIKMHDSCQISKFAGIVITFVSILANFGYHGDLKATAIINVILAKVPPDLKKRTFLILKEDIQIQVLN